MEERRYQVKDIMCAACVSRVEKAVFALFGVHNVSVNLVDGTMIVNVDSDVHSDAIRVAVKKRQLLTCIYALFVTWVSLRYLTNSLSPGLPVII